MLRLELMDTSEPLESDEAESLIRAIHEETLLIERDAKGMMPEPVSGEEREGPTFVVRENLAEFEAESVRRVRKASEKVLSPGQLKTFRRMLEQQREVERTMEQMSRAQMEALK